MAQRPNAAADFWGRVDRSGDCWLWMGGVVTNGYGRFYHDGTVDSAHRFAYREAVGEPLHTLDHICHNRDMSCRGGRSCVHRRCVKPEHLEDVPSVVNRRRGLRPTCLRGHAFTDANTYHHRGVRHCRTCRREWAAARKVHRA